MTLSSMGGITPLKKDLEDYEKLEKIGELSFKSRLLQNLLTADFSNEVKEKMANLILNS